MKQETPKQHVELINDNIDEFDEKIKEFKQIDQTNPVTRGSTALVKQETLEEVAIRFYKESKLSNVTQSFIEGAKWMQEKSYNEEEVNEMFDTLKRNSIDNVATISNVDLFISSWKQEFKNK